MRFAVRAAALFAFCLEVSAAPIAVLAKIDPPEQLLASIGLTREDALFGLSAAAFRCAELLFEEPRDEPVSLLLTTLPEIQPDSSSPAGALILLIRTDIAEITPGMTAGSGFLIAALCLGHKRGRRRR